MPGNAVAITARNELAKLAINGDIIIDLICDRMNVDDLAPADNAHMRGCLRTLGRDLLGDDLRDQDIDQSWRILTDNAWAATEAEVNE